MRVIISPAAARDVGRLSPAVADRMIAALRSLRDNPRPRGCLLLRRRRPPTWRLRVGDWRVLYEINDSDGVVTITGVRRRTKAYR
jgi:mRNA interferase RelE/StbE